LGTAYGKDALRSRLARIAPPFLALAAFLALRFLVIGKGVDVPPWIDNPFVRVDAVTRIANAVLLQARYLFKMIFPAQLTVDYGFDQVPVLSLLPWGAILAVAAIALWAWVFILLKKRSTAAAFFWAFVPVAFAVTGNFAFPIGAIFGERLAYLPLAGFCALAGLGLASLSWPASRALAAVGILVVALGARTALRSRDFGSLVALNEATAAASPRSVKALANQGRTLLRTGKPREAIAPLERAVAIWPDYARALDLLSQAHAATGDAVRAGEYQARAAAAAAKGAGEREE
jgi:hypothetical protein